MTVDVSSIVRLREPGIGQDWIGRERYVVRGGALIAVPVMAGDRIEIIDPEGRQSVHLFGFDSGSGNVTSDLGVRTNVSGSELTELLKSGSEGAAKIRGKLEQFSIDLATSKVAELLDGDTPAGSSAKLISAKEMIVLIGAPGSPMIVDQQNPVTDLIVYIDRADPGFQQHNELPDPLSDEAQSIRIDAATAHAYEVKAGEFIQIIDVDGRQCSDFQCFDKRALDLGKTRNLSATTTRSLMGNAYPGPACISKFYDIDFQPLVEVIQDTCGRHDSFGVACTSKYYDEAGYPGHVNCSGNFNYALEPYPIEPSKGLAGDEFVF